MALVIGNGTYEEAGTLTNPVNDAADIAAKLKRSRLRGDRGQRSRQARARAQDRRILRCARRRRRRAVLLCRPWPAGRWPQFHRPCRRQARRADQAQAGDGADRRHPRHHGAADDDQPGVPRCLPQQSVRAQAQAHGDQPLGDRAGGAGAVQFDARLVHRLLDGAGFGGDGRGRAQLALCRGAAQAYRRPRPEHQRSDDRGAPRRGRRDRRRAAPVGAGLAARPFRVRA